MESELCIPLYNKIPTLRIFKHKKKEKKEKKGRKGKRWKIDDRRRKKTKEDIRESKRECNKSSYGYIQ